MAAEHAGVAAPDLQRDRLEHVVCDLCGADDSRRLFLKHGCPVVRCRVCGLSYVTPRRPWGDQVGLYADEHYYHNANACGYGYGDYVRDHRLLEPLAARRMATIEELHPVRGRLLDVGCATGVLIKEAEQRGWETHGVDVSDFAVAYCRRQQLRVYRGDLEEAAFPTSFFDVAVMDDTIEHLPSPSRTLHELWRIVAPGGLLTINTANEGGLLRRLMGRHWFHYKPMEHLYYFNRSNLTELLRRAGFRVFRARLSGKIVSVRYLCQRFRAYSPLASRALLAPLARLPGGDSLFFLPIGEFVVFAERC